MVGATGIKTCEPYRVKAFQVADFVEISKKRAWRWLGTANLPRFAVGPLWTGELEKGQHCPAPAALPCRHGAPISDRTPLVY